MSPVWHECSLFFFILFFYKAVKEKEEPKAAGTPTFCHQPGHLC